MFIVGQANEQRSFQKTKGKKTECTEHGCSVHRNFWNKSRNKGALKEKNFRNFWNKYPNNLLIKARPVVTL
jgi:hypothetical protein